MSKFLIKQNIEVDIIDIVVSFIGITSCVMLLQLVIGVYKPINALWISILFCGCIMLFIVRRAILPKVGRDFLIVIFLFIAILLPRWSPFLYSEGGQDQGIYVSMASHFTRTGGIHITDTVRSSLDDTDKIKYDKRNNSQSITMERKAEGWHQPGVYIGDLSKSSYVFQFYPLHPLWMGFSGMIFGDENKVNSLVMFSLLNILILSFIVYEITKKNKSLAFVFAGLLAVNPMHVFFSRFPVTENVTLFFSASALLYFIKYIKSRDTASPSTWYLVVSTVAWVGVFFTHIAGFMYAPILFGLIVYCILTVKSEVDRWSCIGYGISVFFAYVLSLWYGMIWSFPYSIDLYPQIFGKSIGLFFVHNWLSVSIAIGAFFSASIIYISKKRNIIIKFWVGLNLTNKVNILLITIIYSIIVINLFNGYRLGYTSDYSENPFLNDRYNLVNTGFHGLMHSTFMVLTVYLSPFLMLFALLAMWINRRDFSFYTTFLLSLIAVFMFARVAKDDFTFYYYYGRYLCVELLPFFLIASFYWMSNFIEKKGRVAIIVCSMLIVSSASWSIVILGKQFPGGEMHRFDASIQTIIRTVNKSDLLVLAGGQYPALLTALEYHYGKNIMVANTSDVNQMVQMGRSKWSDIYILSDSDAMTDYIYVGAVTLERDMYSRAESNIIPSRSMTQNKQFFLYKVNRPASKYLREGSLVSFDDKGISSDYLVSGWSNQEKSYRWTEGTAASLSLPILSSSNDLILLFELRSHNCASVVVNVNGSLRTKWTFSDCSRVVERTLELSKADFQYGKVSVVFDIPNAVSPHDVDPNQSDRRKLGLLVTKFGVFGHGSRDANLLSMTGFERALAQGVSFSDSVNQDIFLETDGLSGAETWGRWTVGDLAKFKFVEPLPKEFSLVLTGGAYGPNVGKPIKFKVGSVTRDIVFTSDAYLKPKEYQIKFSLPEPSDTLEIFIPEPTMPGASDTRRLGIGLVTLKILK